MKTNSFFAAFLLSTAVLWAPVNAMDFDNDPGVGLRHRPSQDGNSAVTFLQNWLELGLVKTNPIGVQKGQTLTATCTFEEVTALTALAFINSAQNAYYEGGVTVQPGQTSVTFSSIVPEDETQTWLIIRNPGFDGKTPLPLGVRINEVLLSSSLQEERFPAVQSLEPVFAPQEGLISEAEVIVPQAILPRLTHMTSSRPVMRGKRLPTSTRSATLRRKSNDVNSTVEEAGPSSASEGLRGIEDEKKVCKPKSFTIVGNQVGGLMQGMNMEDLRASLRKTNF